MQAVLWNMNIGYALKHGALKNGGQESDGSGQEVAARVLNRRERVLKFLILASA